MNSDCESFLHQMNGKVMTMMTRVNGWTSITLQTKKKRYFKWDQLSSEGSLYLECFLFWSGWRFGFFGNLPENICVYRHADFFSSGFGAGGRGLLLQCVGAGVRGLLLFALGVWTNFRKSTVELETHQRACKDSCIPSIWT